MSGVGEVIAFEQQRHIVCLRARIGKTIAHIETGLVAAPAKRVECVDGMPANLGSYINDLGIRLFDEYIDRSFGYLHR